MQDNMLANVQSQQMQRESKTNYKFDKSPKSIKPAQKTKTNSFNTNKNRYLEFQK